ncbi:MAG: hypothetical protein OXU29_02700 [Gammaproteobacteria bacterium]|nr:hypothetical protein [Gammaproteobacteria bacterium]
MVEMPQLIKHLELIQNVIIRMADNSFALKRWSVLLLTAVIAFSWRFDTDGVLILLALFPVLVFLGA